MQQLKTLVKAKIIILQETKLTKMEEHKRFLKNFGFTYEIVPADSNAGGRITLFLETFKMLPILKNPTCWLLLLIIMVTMKVQ